MSNKRTILPALFTGLEFEARIVSKAITGNNEPGPSVHSVGMGAIRAAEKVQQAVNDGAAGIISFGVCGALSGQLESGFTILPKNILDKQESIAVDRHWHARLQALLEPQFDVNTGDLVSVAQTVATVKDKQALAAQTGAVAVDMESAILARLATRYKLPFIAIRVVHDTASMEIPKAFTDIIDTVEGSGKIDKWKLIKGLLFNWPGWKVIKEHSSANEDAMSNLDAITKLALPDFKLTK